MSVIDANQKKERKKARKREAERMRMGAIRKTYMCKEHKKGRGGGKKREVENGT